ncbi:MAG: DUF4870 domain-containing protein [Planctomycetaceae bacterium]|nr:DUF4870 domain-containing protein [Planctomycetaceae bacterium]
MSDPNAWFWSQDGSSRGPVEFAELARLAALGVITPTTSVFDPSQQAWVAASTVAGIEWPRGARTPPTTPPASPPDASGGPADASADPTRCRFCRGAVPPSAVYCATCGRATSPHAYSLDPRVAEVVCRASVLASPFINVLSLIGPAIVWSLGAERPRVVAEAKSALNCLITLCIVSLAAIVFGFIGSPLVIPPLIAGLVYLALIAYCIVVGVRGLVASAKGASFQYPWTFRIIP